MSARPPRFPLSLDRVAAPAPARLHRPQAPLEHAAALASRAATMPRAPGSGLDSDHVRRRMVERLRRDPGAPEPVLQAFGRVDRHLFVDSALAAQAYEDTSLPIGHGQTISKPSVIARMLALLWQSPAVAARGGLGRVLEIGTGCGYQAALLSCLATQVVSVERVRALHERARETLAGTRRHHLRLVFADGCHGHPPNAPYDTILAAAGGDDVPPAWLEQLAVGGRLVAPCRAPGGHGQVLVVVDRDETGWRRSTHEAVQFVPLKSGIS